MKKTLIAIAALAATGAFAQSTVSIVGVVDAGYVSYNLKGNGIAGIDRNLTATSNLGFRVTSDLGGGLKASWVSDSNFNPVSATTSSGAVGNVGATTGAIANGAGTTNGTASTFMNAEQKLVLAGGLGTVSLGAVNNAALGAHLYSQPFGTAIGSGFKQTSGAITTESTRLDNSLLYVSPAFGGGFTIGALVRKQQAVLGTNAAFGSTSLGAQSQAQALDWNLSYNGGPINATLVRATNDNSNVQLVTAGTGAVAPTTASGKGTFTALAGNYNMGATTVYGGYQSNKSNPYGGANSTDRATVTVGAQYVAGVNTWMGSYQRASSALANATSAANLLGLGYEYALSKTAALTARYERIGDGTGTGALTNFTGTPFGAVGVASDRTRMGVGLRVGF